MVIAVFPWTLSVVWSSVLPIRVSFPHSPLGLCNAVLPPAHMTLLSPMTEPHPDLGCQLYLHLPQQQPEEVEQLLEVSGEPDKGWQGVAGCLGYQAEAVEIMTQGQVPAYTLLRDWAVEAGSRVTLRVLKDILAAMGREDVVRVLDPPAEGCSVV